MRATRNHQTPAHSFVLGGQRAWFHDEGYAYGPLHTYDAFRLGAEAPRKLHVIVPHDYGETAERLPVVYMNDGQTAIFPGGPAGKTWRVAEALGALRARGEIPALLLVAVHPAARDREYTHAPWFRGHDYGGLDSYARYLAGDLRPWIDAHYRSDPRAEKTAIVGSSHGGLAAFYAGCLHPERFHLVGALSPSFWVGRSPAGLHASPLLTATRPVLADPRRRPRIWIDWGMRSDGGMRGAMEMAALLQSEFGYLPGEDLFVFEDAHGAHDEVAWGSRFPSVLRALYGADRTD